MSVYKGNKQPSLHGTVDDFFRRPHAGPLAQDLAAAHATRGKNAHFSRNCYNTAALRDRIPSCIRLWKHKGAFTKETKTLLCTEPLTIFSADRTQGLLHRILLPHTPRAGKMHISPATVTTLPHCEKGYLAAYVCGNAQMSFHKGKQKAYFFTHHTRKKTFPATVTTPEA